MKNPGILKWRAWPAIRNGMIYGALTGAVVSVVGYCIIMQTQDNGIWMLIGPALTLPTHALFGSLHWEFLRLINPVFLMLVVNTFIYSAVGGPSGM